MRSLFPYRQKRVSIGIDISSYSMEILALSTERDVLSYERKILEKGILENGRVKKKDIFHMRLDQLIAKVLPFVGRLADARVTANVPEEFTYIRYFSLPSELAKEELAKQIWKEAEKSIPVAERELTSVHFILEEGTPDTPQRIFFVAARKDVVQDLLLAFREVGVENVTLELESMALARALLPQSVQKTGSATLILDGGAETINMNVFESSVFPVISAAYPQGGVHATENIAKHLSLSFEEAEKVKNAFGFMNALQENSEEEQDSSVAKQTSRILHDFFTGVVKELQEMIAYYERERERRVSQVLLTGGFALLPAVIPYLSHYIGRPIRIADPLQRLRTAEVVGKERPSAVFGPVIGFALRGVMDGGGIDLAKGTALREKTPWWPHYKKRIIIAVGIMVILGIGIFLASYFLQDSPDSYLYTKEEQI